MQAKSHITCTHCDVIGTAGKGCITGMADRNVARSGTGARLWICKIDRRQMGRSLDTFFGVGASIGNKKWHK